MSLASRRLRSLLIALAVLALSATAALAGRTMGTPQHQVATQGQGGDEQAEGSESPEPSESEAPEASDAPESPDADSGDATDGANGVHPDNHGKLVSEAAQSATPDGFDNHGAYVKTIAQDNAGHAGAAAQHAGKQH